MDNVTALARPAVAGWTDEQKNLIKRTVAENATDAELAMFLHVAAKAGLDPLQKQVWFVKRKQNVGTRENPKWEERVTIQAGVDGLQARALRMPDCEGIMSAAVYAKDDFSFDMRTGEVQRHQGNPFGERGSIVGAWAIVKRAGKMPFVALVRFSEYVDERSFLWKNKPAVMIEKVARSTALRRAYPEDFAGIYDPAEMGSAAHVEAEHVEQTPTPAPAALPPRTVEAEIVQPKAEEPKPEPKRSAVPPPHVSALWTRVRKNYGPDAKTKFEGAAALHFKANPKPSHEWTPEDSAAIAELIFGDADIKF
jgi:phage recombination protein Bet